MCGGVCDRTFSGGVVSYRTLKQPVLPAQASVGQQSGLASPGLLLSCRQLAAGGPARSQMASPAHWLVGTNRRLGLPPL